MKRPSERIFGAVLIAPWSVIPVSAVGSVWYGFTAAASTPEVQVFPDPTRHWEFVLLYSIYGVPTAYMSLLVFLPLYLVLARFNWVSYRTTIAAGFLACVPAAFFYGRSGFDFSRILVFLLPYGAVASACFLWFVRRSSPEAVEPVDSPPARPGEQRSP